MGPMILDNMNIHRFSLLIVVLFTVVPLFFLIILSDRLHCQSPFVIMVNVILTESEVSYEI